MTLNEMIKEFQKLVEANPATGERIVIMSKDGEGNGYSPYADFGFQKYDAESTWSGEAYPDEPSDDDDEDEWDAPDTAVPAIILWPTN